MTYEYGPLDTYEVIWKSGHTERVRGHQVLLPPMNLFGEARRVAIRDTHVMIHGQIDGRWKLVLAAPAERDPLPHPRPPRGPPAAADVRLGIRAPGRADRPGRGRGWGAWVIYCVTPVTRRTRPDADVARAARTSGSACPPIAPTG